jgi:aldose 1-epimerase
MGHRAIELERARFQGTLEGRTVDLYTLRGAGGLTARISNYGARLQQLLVPDRHGAPGDVLLGYASLAAVQRDPAWMGAFIGRHANRIGGARLERAGRRWPLPANDGAHSLHGGARGCALRVFEARQPAADALELAYRFTPDDGFPGELRLALSYRLHGPGRLVMQWEAEALGEATVASFTSHGYFNLSGLPQSTVLDHELWLAADSVLESDADLVPTGRSAPVDGTPLDFRTPRPLGRDLDPLHPALRAAGGYDHYLIDTHARPGALAHQATLRHPGTGRVLQVWSTEPGLQLYTGNRLHELPPEAQGKHGERTPRHGGLCLEPSGYPDAPNHPHFPTPWLEPGERRSGCIELRFGVDSAADRPTPVPRS